MSDICERARIAYNAGIDPIDYAEREITILAGIHLSLTALADDVGASGSERDAVSLPAMARRILGSLMDAGWVPPEVPGAWDEPEVTECQP